MSGFTAEQVMALQFAAGLNAQLRAAFPDAAVSVRSTEDVCKSTGVPWVRLKVEIRWADDSIGGEICSDYVYLIPNQMTNSVRGAFEQFAGKAALRRKARR